jgi:hypothetical protein
MQRGLVGQLAQGMLLDPAVHFQDIGHRPRSMPPDNH